MKKDSFLLRATVGTLVLGLLTTVAWANLTFGVNNQTSLDLGEVTLQHSSGSTSIFVPSAGNYVTEVRAEVIGITIEGQTVVRPNQGSITVNGSTVYLDWGSNIVRVLDWGEW